MQTTPQTVYISMYHSTNCNCAYMHTPQSLHLYAPQHKLSVIVPMHTPQTVYISMHHSTNCLDLYPCRPHHRLFISLCTTAQTVIVPICTRHRLFTSLCTTVQTVCNCTYADTIDCLYLYAPQHKLSVFVPMQTTPQTV